MIGRTRNCVQECRDDDDRTDASATDGDHPRSSVDARRCLTRRARRLPRHHRVVRGVSGHRRHVRHGGTGTAVVGAECVHDRVRRAAGAGGKVRRPARAQAGVPRRLCAVHRCLDGVRPRTVGGHPDRVPRGAGDRRRHPHPLVARSTAARVPARQGSLRRRHLGCQRCGGGCVGADARRRSGGDRQLAVGLLHQPADRVVHRVRRAPRPA
jgi:hypothetical protein